MPITFIPIVPAAWLWAALVVFASCATAQSNQLDTSSRSQLVSGGEQMGELATFLKYCGLDDKAAALEDQANSYVLYLQVAAASPSHSRQKPWIKIWQESYQHGTDAARADLANARPCTAADRSGLSDKADAQMQVGDYLIRDLEHRMAKRQK